MPKIGVYTDDFMFYHNAIKLLKKWDLPFVDIASGEKVPDEVKFILSSNTDQDIWPVQIMGKDPLNALRKGMPRIIGKMQFTKLIIGVDPGPRPGIAVLGDHILLEAFETTAPGKAPAQILGILGDYSYRDSVVKIGHGDLPNRSIIEEGLRKSGVETVIVDESNTSFPHNLHNNALSAARIAMDQNYPVSAEYIHGAKRKELFDLEFITIKRLMA